MNNPYSPPKAPLALPPAGVKAHAARWRRVAARVIDMGLWVLVMEFLMFFVRASQDLSLAFVPFHGLSFALYHFYMHGKTGQTLGKRWMRLRVVRSDGSAMGCARSARRTFLTAAASIPWIVAKMSALSHISAGQFDPFKAGVMKALEAAYWPAWHAYAEIAITVWFLAEVLSWIFTKRRQSVSDLIADTVVVSVPKNSAGANNG
jgi:uncharacterized RDD family membrane protein YckC